VPDRAVEDYAIKHGLSYNEAKRQMGRKHAKDSKKPKED
jgi:hypothetical protein